MQRFYLLIHVVRFYKVEEEKEQSYEYRYDYIPATTPYNRRPGTKLEPTSITIHSTGNPSSTAKNERAC